MSRLKQFQPNRENWWFYALVLLLVGYRFFHFGEAIDGPHTWRQCDTAHYILDQYKNGFDLLHPSVCWMGGHGTMILEFPLPEFLVAGFYRLFGESHIWARVVFFAFFLGSALYFFRILKLISSVLVAQMGTLFYLAAPLSLFYSRAVHIDFTAIFFAHGMLYYYLAGIQDKSNKKMLWATAFATLAFLIKAPYAFYLALPILGWTIQKKQVRFLIQWLPSVLLPIGVLLLWVGHTKAVNSQAPDWDFIPGYHKFTDMSHWYFGAWSQRIDSANWSLIGSRIFNEILGYSGALLATIGLVFGFRKNAKPYFIGLLWLLGTIVYILIFFNLNRVHNYYQLPMLAPAALMVGLGFSVLKEWLAPVSSLVFKCIVSLAVLAMIAEPMRYAEAEYYEVRTDQVSIGKHIKSNTAPDDLVIVSYGGLHVKCPNVLYRARRSGWSIMHTLITPELSYRLYGEGARYLALVRYSPPEAEMAHFTKALNSEQVFEIDETGLKLYLYELRPEAFEQ